MGKDVDKAPDAFRTISEVADELDVPQHVLRFWETRFAQIKPMKRGGGRRYYRPDDVDLLRGIRHLLYGEGYTIRGVQRLLKDNGAKFVQSVWIAETASSATPPVSPFSRSSVEEARESVADDAADEEREEILDEGQDALDVGAAREPMQPTPSASPESTRAAEPALEARIALKRSNPVAIVAAPEATEKPLPASALSLGPAVSLSTQDRGRLEAALFELGECRRLLDAALRE